MRKENRKTVGEAIPASCTVCALLLSVLYMRQQNAERFFYAYFSDCVSPLTSSSAKEYSSCRRTSMSSGEI